MIAREELQRLLREFGGPLAAAEVKPQSEVVFTNDHDVKVCFLANIYGTPEHVEVELDLRSIRDVEGVVGLAGKIREALEARAAAVKGGARMRAARRVIDEHREVLTALKDR